MNPSVLASLKRVYWRAARGELPLVEAVRDRLRVRQIELARTLIGSLINGWDAGRWAEVLGDPRLASVRLQESPHVDFLKQYRALGDKLFEWKHLEPTAYYRAAVQSILYEDGYFGHRTREGIRLQAKVFAALYERMAKDDPSEVVFPEREAHSPAGSPPVVQGTLTPGTCEIVDGHHRLAAAWVLGMRRLPAIVLPPRPTALQRLVMLAGPGRSSGPTPRRLCQPIESAEFDESWEVAGRCPERLEAMLAFLACRGLALRGLSVLDAGCRYGWFVHELASQGCEALGIDWDPAALKVGKIVYGLREEQVRRCGPLEFLNGCERRFDVVLLLNGWQGFRRGAEVGSAEALVGTAARVTGTVLFVDVSEAWAEAVGEEEGPAGGETLMMEWLKRNTSFDEVLPVGRVVETARARGDAATPALFACVRS